MLDLFQFNVRIIFFWSVSKSRHIGVSSGNGEGSLDCGLSGNGWRNVEERTGCDGIQRDIRISEYSRLEREIGRRLHGSDESGAGSS